MPLTNLAPRFGFSYSATPSLVLRGGYGITYTQFNRAGGENNLTYNGPNVVNATINNPVPTADSTVHSRYAGPDEVLPSDAAGLCGGLTARPTSIPRW